MPMATTIGVSIAVPHPHGDTLQRCREEFGDPLARAIPTHITILPPTTVPDQSRALLEDHLHDVCASTAPFEVHLRGTGTFRPVSPVVFVRLAAGIAECEVLEAAVRSGPVERQLEFTYHPHVTVAHHLADQALDHALESLRDFEARFVATGVHVYEHGRDEVWRPVSDFRFGLL